MRIQVLGECSTAKAIRGYLSKHDFNLTHFQPDFTVHVDEQADAVRPALDSVGSDLEHAILRHLRKQTSTPVEIHTAGGVQSDHKVRIVVPPVESERRAVEIAVFRALLELSQQALQPALVAAWRKWIQRKKK
jgi:hypothetical protein